jgi:hypothetical protein
MVCKGTLESLFRASFNVLNSRRLKPGTTYNKIQKPKTSPMHTTAQNQNYYQTIVARGVPSPKVERTAKTALEWMADELIIADDLTTCIPSRPDEHRVGRRPGELWQSAIVEIDESFLDRACNGVESLTGRQLFDAGGYQSRPYCPECNTPVGSGRPNTLTQWTAALDAWASGDDSAGLRCPRCGATSAIIEWRHDPPIGFGNLGLVFWNWPSLNREFIVRLGKKIGHDLTLVEGM